MTAPSTLRTSAARARPLDLVAGPSPAARVLSNGTYRVLLSGAGTGSSSCGGFAMTRWRGDRVEDPDGFFFYLRDRESNELWSATLRPNGDHSDAWSADSGPGSVRHRRDHDGIESTLETCVAPHDSAELRRLTLVNRSLRRRLLDVTSFGEIVLHHPDAHESHPEFSKLFVQTELVAERRAILVRRRPRSPEDVYPVVVHALLEEGACAADSDRERFLGRGGSVARPAALRPEAAVSGTFGDVLDPAIVLQRAVSLEPGASVTMTFLLGAADDRSGALALTSRFADAASRDGAFEGAALAERERFDRLGLTVTEGEAWLDLAAATIYGDPRLRAEPEVLARSRADLARLAISENAPLVVLRNGAGSPAFQSEFEKALRLWRELGIPIEGRTLGADLDARDRDILETAARCVLEESRPDLAAVPPAPSRATPSPATPAPFGAPPAAQLAAPPAEPLEFFNGFGGFAADASEYCIRVRRPDDADGIRPPRPWINVLANESFGALVSESGAGFTWSGNSREHRLTPWSNDPLLDPHDEALYLRDESDGALWSLFPGPRPAPVDYEVRHGFGATRSLHTCRELDIETTVFVPRADSVRVTQVRVTNRGKAARRLSFYSYSRLVLGATPETSGRFVVTGAAEAACGVLLARNAWADEFAGGVAFASAAGTNAETPTWTADRAEFLGQGGSAGDPAALRPGADLGKASGAGLDACFAHRVELEIAPGASADVVFTLGEAESEADAIRLARRFADAGEAGRALAEVRAFWNELRGRVHVRTPSRELDILLNGWLPVQTLACRLWGRSAFYQSGGAFGFRDQLQDALALLAHDPSLAREQILRNAAHQFVEGDVLHWWHPPLSRGIRTRFADDLLWMPLLAATYANATGDHAVFDENVEFLRARLLEPGEDETFLEPRNAGESASLYEHCARAIDRSLTRGAHGLPLFGTGDWNDGMNRVGRQGRGESVWMAFFLDAVFDAFVPVCRAHGDAARVDRYTTHRAELRAAVEANAWDGDWYLRAFYDDGTPLGSSKSEECKIDALAQAWSVLSGVASAERGERAMDAALRHLVSEQDGLVRLLTPPFENTPHDPGYIKGYVKGVRENGGQYTHAALWVVAALAKLGRRDRAFRVLDMLNPIRHSRTEDAARVYRVEPYVVAADVYGAPPHVGRGGWTWYTGSAGWMIRVAMESILGVRVVEGRTIEISPCVPDEWPEFTVNLRLPATGDSYAIRVVNPGGRADRVVGATVDGRTAATLDGKALVTIAGDGGTHRVEVILGASPPSGNEGAR